MGEVAMIGLDLAKNVFQIHGADRAGRAMIRKQLPLAFLAPDIVQEIAEGRQPVGLTTEWLITTDLPVRWDDQRALIARL